MPITVTCSGCKKQYRVKEELAGKAPLKMMFPTLLIFAATLLVTLGPGMLRLVGFFAERQG